MSWSASIPSPIAKNDTNEIVGTPQNAPEGVDDAYADQFETAKEAVALLVSAVGREGDLVHVSMSGHANPEHAPCEGWADEQITITVQARPSK